MEYPPSISRLANQRTVGCDDKLYQGKVPLKPKADFSLPCGVEMRVNFINHDYARPIYIEVTFVVACNKLYGTVYIDHMTKYIDQHC